jgi:hypothetical protein
MFYLIIISLSLFAVGIFFLDLAVCLWILPVLFIACVVTAIFVRRSQIKSLFKSLLFLLILLIPIFLVKLFTLKSGQVFNVWVFRIYSEGIYTATHSVVRIFILFLAVFLFLKLIFPLERYKDKYSHIPIFNIIFQSIELFPNIMSAVFAIFKRRDKNSKKRGRPLIEAIDDLYVDGAESKD